MVRHEGEDSEAEDNGPFDIDFEPVGPLNLPVPVVKEKVVAAPDGGGGGTSQDQPDPLVKDPDEIDDPLEYLDNAVQVGESYNEMLDRAIEAETCDYCESVLRGLKSEPAETQIQGVRELREVKEVLTQGEMPDKEELKELVEDNEVVDLGMDV